MHPPDGPDPNVAQLYDDAPCGLLVTREDGLIERVNRAICHWTGFPADALVGTRRFQDMLTVGGRIFHQTHLAPLLRMQGSVAEVKLDLITTNGSTLPILVNASRYTCDCTVRHALAVFVAKERHAYERELMAARRNAEHLAERQRQTQAELQEIARRKDEFLAMLAHELRNPLAPIATAAQVLKHAVHDPVRVDGIAGMIERQIGHLTHLVDDLMDVSRVTRGLIELDREPVDLASVIAAAVEQSRPLIDERGHSLSLEVEPGLVVDGDRTRLVQIVANLLNNSAKYTRQGGHVAVTLRAEKRGARVDVVDTGIGIDATLLPHVFDLFSQAERTPDRSQGGLGIGLALVRSLVRLHAGEVEAHSDGPHRGSRFTLRFPLSMRSGIAPSNEPAQQPQTTSPARVLIVDDNADAAYMLADVIRFAGHTVEIATSARGALAHLQGDTRRPDVCILDIGLPDITGYELATRIRTIMAASPPLLIALTGYGQPRDRVLSKAAGFDHHLVKPADPELLLALLARADSDAGVR